MTDSSSPALVATVALSALDAATVGGVFFGFSALVMPGLRRSSPAAAIEAMKQINVVAVRPPLMALPSGTAGLCAVLLVWSLLNGEARRHPALLIGPLLYLLGAVAVTGGGNVPLNDRLAGVPADPSGAAARAGIASRWTVLNPCGRVPPWPPPPSCSGRCGASDPRGLR